MEATVDNVILSHAIVMYWRFQVNIVWHIDLLIISKSSRTGGEIISIAFHNRYHNPYKQTWLLKYYLKLINTWFYQNFLGILSDARGGCQVS